MAAALRQLGYTVYDYMEQYEEIGDELMKISKYGGTVEDFRRIFEGVDAVTDLPAYHYWEQILEAFPDAKVGVIGVVVTCFAVEVVLIL